MPLIDDEGNLFGVVNVVDALAVCLVLAVLVAGVAVVGVLGDGNETAASDDPENDSQPATRYTTIDLGVQPDYVVTSIHTGDQAAGTIDGHNLTITDVYVSPTNGGNKGHVVVRTKIEGEYPPTNSSKTAFRFNNSSIRIGGTMTVDTGDYALQGTVQRLEGEGTTLETERTTVGIETRASSTVAEEIEAGDEYQFAGQTVATVANVTTTELNDTSQKAVDLQVDLVTFNRAGTQMFGGQSLQTGSQIPIRTDHYEISGKMIHRGQSVPIDERN
ncbi:DUF4330 family protein [Natrinema sp. HArc-T2]|uniref:DUF4330 family protein n=1 Tax=Natrinema sp. HArc-T2 TaxID=3242701 RepID=UPI00359EE14B